MKSVLTEGSTLVRDIHCGGHATLFKQLLYCVTKNTCSYCMPLLIPMSGICMIYIISFFSTMLHCSCYIIKEDHTNLLSKPLKMSVVRLSDVAIECHYLSRCDSTSPNCE